jgi:phosphoribosylformylglycinamidine synthase
MAQSAGKFNPSSGGRAFSRAETKFTFRSRGRSPHQFLKIPRFDENFSAKSFRASMKAKIIITPKKAVLDPQGKTVQTALEHMGYTGVTGVHIGKYIEIDLAPGTDKAAASKALNDAAHKLLSNPVIEDYKLEIE